MPSSGDGGGHGLWVRDDQDGDDLGLHDIGKKLTLRYFVFLQYILRYEEEKKHKKKQMILISLFGKKKSMIGVIL